MRFRLRNEDGWIDVTPGAFAFVEDDVLTLLAPAGSIDVSLGDEVRFEEEGQSLSGEVVAIMDGGSSIRIQLPETFDEKES